MEALKTNKEIIEEVKEILKGMMPDYELRSQQITKNNDEKLDAVAFLKEGSVIGPTIYTDNWILDYRDGMSPEQIAVQARKAVEDAMLRAQDITINFDRDYILKNAFGMVMCMDSNIEYLKDAVCEPVDGTDLMMVVRVRAGEDASFVLKRDATVTFGLTYEEAVEAAYRNMEKEEAVIKPVQSIIAEMMGVSEREINDMVPSSEVDMIVITNERKFYGAGEIFLKNEVRDELFNRIGEYYILPSSLHETIVIPKTYCEDYHMLESMLREINRQEILPKDRLSDTVYRYDGRRLTLASAPEMEIATQAARVTMHM